MSSCNGFSTTLGLRSRSLSRRFRCRLVHRSPNGRWRLCLSNGDWLRAELGTAWLAGPVAGLRFHTRSRAIDVLILGWEQDPDHWRRLRVQLKLPPT